jgi:hypothetical protein
MARPLTRCGHCGVHIYADEAKCPFCSGSTARRRVDGVTRAARTAFAAAAGVAAFVSGIGCAYGCPDGACGDDAGSGGDAATDTLDDRGLRPDVSVQDAGAEDVMIGEADARLDAPNDG